MSPQTPPAIFTHTIGNFDAKAQNEAIYKWSSFVQRRMREITTRFVHGKVGISHAPADPKQNYVSVLQVVLQNNIG